MKLLISPLKVTLTDSGIGIVASPVAKAKATAVSPRSVTPSGQVKSTDAKDRRSLLMANLADAEGGRV